MGTTPVAGDETLNRDDLRLETLFMSLRTAAGIDVAAFLSQFDENVPEIRRSIIESLIASGFIVVSDERISPTRRGLAVADQLALIL